MRLAECVHLRGRENVLKRLPIRVADFNLSLIFRKMAGAETPRELHKPGMGTLNPVRSGKAPWCGWTIRAGEPERVLRICGFGLIGQP